MGIQIESEQDNAEFEASMKLYEISRRLIAMGFNVSKQFPGTRKNLIVAVTCDKPYLYIHVQCRWNESPGQLLVDFTSPLLPIGNDFPIARCQSVVPNRIEAAYLIADIVKRFWPAINTCADKPQKG